jgi:hypothetical protein
VAAQPPALSPPPPLPAGVSAGLSAATTGLVDGPLTRSALHLYADKVRGGMCGVGGRGGCQGCGAEIMWVVCWMWDLVQRNAPSRRDGGGGGRYWYSDSSIL